MHITTKFAETKELTLSEMIMELFNNPPEGHMRYREKNNPNCYIDVWKTGDSEPEITFSADTERFNPNHRFTTTVLTTVTVDTEFDVLVAVSGDPDTALQETSTWHKFSIRQLLSQYNNNPQHQVRRIYALIGGDLKPVWAVEYSPYQQALDLINMEVDVDE